MSRDAGPELVAQVLHELDELRTTSGGTEVDPELEAVKAAILLEDALGVVLTDEDIDPDLLGDPAAVARLVERRGRG